MAKVYVYKYKVLYDSYYKHCSSVTIIIVNKVQFYSLSKAVILCLFFQCILVTYNYFEVVNILKKEFCFLNHPCNLPTYLSFLEYQNVREFLKNKLFLKLIEKLGGQL